MTPDRFLNSLQSIRRDLAHAVRSLAKERAFTFVCVVSLGIGLGAVVALATFSRAILSPARGIGTGSAGGLAGIFARRHLETTASPWERRRPAGIFNRTSLEGSSTSRAGKRREQAPPTRE